MRATSGVGRRELLLAFAGGTAVQGEPVQVSPWRAAGQVFGVRIREGRWRVLQPVLERRAAQLAALRGFRVAEGVEPVQGVEG